MIWQAREAALLTILSALLSVAPVSSCGAPLNDPKIDADQLCALSEVEFAKPEVSVLLSALEQQFSIPRNKMRVAPNGVFVPTWERFVEEGGYFVAKPGVNMTAKGSDPSFKRFKKCIYRYRIKG